MQRRQERQASAANQSGPGGQEQADEKGGPVGEFVNDNDDNFEEERCFSDDEFAEEDLEEEENVERKFNFLADLAVLLEYFVIEKYLIVIRDKDHYDRNPFLLKACSAFFKRIVHQVKQVWIFF